ncbi:methyl-accepting chemotaxis protein [Pseudogulbenkiania subflava]|uniref:Methyl-accepting chemotaxis protein n=1 Tax=Pseudogulbenkiania subflava DSM 22618 TaxID=1123014 RepID=A0A1Y6B847_9NEIS|nr:methyl-accepting chemotaxis protein [Pseudogulbenkiania subflava]SME97849.1 methyl-accepting chemotaxis protein [Pseudogulbenkiania subflava DSM 22618]
MNISQRILLTLAVALLSLLGIGGNALWQQGNANSRFVYMKENTFPSIATLNEAKSALASSRLATFRHAIHNGDDRKVEQERVIAEQDKHLDDTLNRYEKELISNEEDRKQLDNDRQALRRYRDSRAQFLQLSRTHQNQEAEETLVNGEMARSATAVRDALERHVKFNIDQADKLGKENAAAYSNAITLSVTIIAAAILICGTLGFLLFTQIRRHLAEIQDTMQQVGTTLDFRLRAKADKQDEIGLTARAFNELLGKLQQSFRDIRQSIGAIDQAMEGMACNTTEIARSSEVQSESASSMAAAIEQLTVSINHVADRARDASQQTEEAGQMASQGGAVILATAHGITDVAGAIDGTAGKIARLRNDGETIASVVSVIKDIAEQTNLLALNAAIEAARAGEMGRGFAVVADEVRKLAERTSHSTMEIANVITQMKEGTHEAVNSMQEVVERVSQETGNARQANQAIEQIQGNTQRAQELVRDISDSIVEQSTASNTIAQRVEQIAQMAEENAAAASGSAEAADQLRQQARHILETVSQYQV